MSKLFIAAISSIALLGSAPLASAIPTVGSMPDAGNGLTLVYGGCGPFGHRGPYGGCRAGGQRGGYGMGRPCPPGFHLGRGGRRCWPN